ncbi:hypothetical protein QR680_014408 [Steinernema hermaphroditum]|uniref:Leishmanolysin-like peptidase n=1 Tax=Steinernema hermaphroditum TaxID=289476 RepID=A0AA39M408_9BILA|nr:hypothetical protein QR680_014408 [Steinernema hermaphroditum]
MFDRKWPDVVCVFFSIAVLGAHALPCSYQTPRVEELVFDVPVGSVEGDGGRSARDLGHSFHPLRIHLYYDESIENLSEEKRLFVNTSLLPEAAGFWSKALLVRRSKKPIKLSRKCQNNHYYLRVDEDHPSCVDGCRASTTCGEVVIPDEHLYQCRYCLSPNPASCRTTGPRDGDGIPHADFLLYVSAVHSERCKNVDTMAYAAHCQQEAELDRPIAGHVNICPDGLSTHQHDQEILLSTVKHEILHALGFSAGLYAFFRNQDGSPRTRRNRYGKPISLNREKGYYDWDESTIKTIMREDWWTSDKTISHPVHVMVTEKVREEAKKHFGCEDLEGAELENQGGDGTAYTHWEKRLFENEAMTGTHTQNPVYSRLTLALLEDSGWYKANYEIAEPLHWGHNLGCQFAMKSCGEWISKQLAAGLSPAPFCSDIKHDGKRSLAITRCTSERDSLALCNLVPYKRELPIDYRNFDYLPGVRREGVIHYGGSVELADFCPYNQEFEWKVVNSTDRRDSRCELAGNSLLEESNPAMEIYGDGARCFDFHKSWTERKCGRVKNFSQLMAGCYTYQCMDGRLYLNVFNGSDYYPCYHTGQHIHIRKIVNGWLREGVLLCPPCEDLCTEDQFKRDDPEGTTLQCRPDTPVPGGGFVGDESVPEPCLSSRCYPAAFLLIAILSFVRL